MIRIGESCHKKAQEHHKLINNFFCDFCALLRQKIQYFKKPDFLRTFQERNYTILTEAEQLKLQISRRKMKIESNRQPEEQLVESAQNGHLESFGALYQRYYSSMVALAYSVLGNRDFAEDAAQEVFAVACRDLICLKHRDRFGAWLAGICRNITRQMIREKARAAVSNLSVPVQNQDNSEHHLDVVCRAVWQLRPAEKELIVLRYYDGFSQAQICKVLDISPQAVNGRLIRAKRKIAKYLNRNGFTGEEL